MKIHFVIYSLGGGGAERACVTLSNGFVHHGIDVELIVLNLKNSILHNELDCRVRLVNLNVEHARTSFWPLMRYILANRPETILVFNQQIAVILVWLRSLLRAKYKIVSRNINTLTMAKKHNSSFWHKNIVDRFVKWFYYHVDKMIAQSYAMKQDLIEHYYIDPEKISVIYNPVNPIIENAAYSQEEIPYKERTYFLSIGRLESQKALEYLIEAFTRAHPSIPDMKLKIAGEGSQHEKLYDLTIAKGMEKTVEFLGFQKQIISLYQGARATLLTSRYEGFPNVLAESITLGTPVIAFDCPSGPSEMIVNGENGFLVEHLNVEAFSKTLIEVVKNNPFDPSIVRNSADRFRSNRIIAEYERVLCT